MASGSCAARTSPTATQGTRIGRRSRPRGSSRSSTRRRCWAPPPRRTRCGWCARGSGSYGSSSTTPSRRRSRSAAGTRGRARADVDAVGAGRRARLAGGWGSALGGAVKNAHALLGELVGQDFDGDEGSVPRLQALAPCAPRPLPAPLTGTRLWSNSAGLPQIPHSSRTVRPYTRWRASRTSWESPPTRIDHSRVV